MTTTRTSRKPLTAAAVDRAVLALERIIEAPDFAELNHPTRKPIEDGREALLHLWGFLKS